MNNIHIPKLRPFLKWAGGKVHLVSALIKYLPEDINERRYIEPFLGGGSLYFHLGPRQSIISDLNHSLIDCYKEVRDSPEQVAKYLQNFSHKNSEKFYYLQRDKYNMAASSPKQAARFIYLNKASFNGIFRVNNKGEFNVPFSHKKKVVLPSIDHLKYVSKVLRKAKIKSSDYKKILESTDKGDFIYLDPPYPPLNGTAYFTHYTKERFSKTDQEELADMVGTMKNKKIRIMISNANTPLIKSLYKGWNTQILPVRRWITCKKEKHLVEELLIKNY